MKQKVKLTCTNLGCKRISFQEVEWKLPEFEFNTPEFNESFEKIYNGLMKGIHITYKNSKPREKTKLFFSAIMNYSRKNNIPFEKMLFFFMELAIRLHLDIEDKVNPLQTEMKTLSEVTEIIYPKKRE